MPLIQWNDKYSVNIKEIDLQHKKLIEYINNLYSYMKQGKSKEIMLPLFSDLYDYTKTHFSYEEKLMRENNYPGYQEHIKEHGEFIKTLDELHEKFNNKSLSVGVDVMTMLKKWLVEHIYSPNSQDKKYAPFFNQKGIL